ncbi:phage holin family protein [Gemella morbillorum]
MDFLNYIVDNALILIPVLYIIGNFLKGLEIINDKYIPLILMAFSIAFSIAILGLNVDSVIQGILIAGTAVLSNQLVKQSKKD